MKATIRVKLLALCILLVLLTTAGLSITYYELTKQNARRESKQRIQIAFEIIFDDLARQSQLYTSQIEEFLQQDKDLLMTLPMLADEKSQTSPGNQRNLLKNQLTQLSAFASIDRLWLYSATGWLLEDYQRSEYPQVSGETTRSNGEIAPSQIKKERFEGELPTAISTELYGEGQVIGIRVIVPVSKDDIVIGLLVGETPLTPDMLERYAALSKTEINIFTNTQLSLGTLPQQETVDSAILKRMASCDMVLRDSDILTIFPVPFAQHPYYQGGCRLQNAQGPVGAITVSLSQEIEQEAIRRILNGVLLVSGIAIGVGVVLAVLFSHKSLRAIEHITQVIGAASDGDLRSTVTTAARDEIGLLANSLNQMITKLRRISEQVQSASNVVTGTADTILQQMDSLIQHMEHQSTSVDGTTVSFAKINQFIDAVALNTTDLLSWSSEILASIQQMRASIAEVTKSTGALTTNLQKILTSVDHVNQTMKQISDHTGQLENVAQHTEHEIHRIDESLQDVSRNADRTQQLAQETMDAASHGQVSVEASIRGMAELKEVVSDTAGIIQEVNDWGTQVSAILGIVDEITEQTALLSLNASIISAQAGEHGRGFGVVAEEIKELANRTKTSTKKIETLVHALQKKTAEGVSHIEQGLQKTDQGMQLANAVKEALEIILERATRSSKRAADTAQVVQQTVTSGQTISAEISRVTEMVTVIRGALQQEEDEIEQVVSAVENISGMAEQVSRANVEQRRAAEEVERSMGDVTLKFGDISEQTDALQQDANQIMDGMRTIESTTSEILHSATDISGDTVKRLVQQSDVLQKIVTIFKVS